MPKYINVIAYLSLMRNCDENFLLPTTFFNLSLSRHKILVGKTLTQERFKSDIEFRYQVKVLETQLKKTFAKFMIQKGLFKKFLSKTFREC